MDSHSATVARVGATFEALLLEEVLRPLARGNDALGQYGLIAVAQTIAEHDTRGFGAVLAGRLNGRAR